MYNKLIIKFFKQSIIQLHLNCINMIFTKCFDEKLIIDKCQIITILRMYCTYNFISTIIGKRIIHFITDCEKIAFYNYMFIEKQLKRKAHK